jgi:DNA-binding transcriptional LysR family regulator
MNDGQIPLAYAGQRLQHLRDFQAVSEAGSIARAANRIFKVKSAITRDHRTGNKPRGIAVRAQAARNAAEEFSRSQLMSATLRSVEREVDITQTKPLAQTGRCVVSGTWTAVPVETGDLAILRQLLNSSDMLTAISPPQFMFEIRAGMLAELPVALGVTTRQIGLTLREGAMLSPAALAVLDAICGVARELPTYIDIHED